MPDLNAPEARIPDAMESMRLLFDGSGAIVDAHTSRPHAPDLLEVQR